MRELTHNEIQPRFTQRPMATSVFRTMTPALGSSGRGSGNRRGRAISMIIASSCSTGTGR